MPRVSVILPNYNYAQFLKERVRSILRQTWTDFELIYLDDASTDNSNAVMETFASDSRVQMHRFSQNSGQVYKRWNDGAALATGDFLWFAGADDTASPQFLEALLPFFEDPAVAVAHCQPLFIDGLGRVRSLDHPFQRRPDLAEFLRSRHVNSPAEEMARMLDSNYPHTASAVLFRRAAFEAVGGYDARIRLCADRLLHLELACAGAKTAYVPPQLATYRQHSDTVTATTKNQRIRLEMAYCISRVYEKIDRFPELAAMKPDLRRRIKMDIFEATAEAAPVPDDCRFIRDYVRKAVG